MTTTKSLDDRAALALIQSTRAMAFHAVWGMMLACAPTANASTILDTIYQWFEPKSGYSIQKSGFSAGGLHGGQAVHWIDNDQILFFGTKLGSQGDQGIWIWNTRSNEFKLHARVGEYANLCYSKGFVRYQVSGPTRLKDDVLSSPPVIRRGRLGEEQEWKMPPEDLTKEGLNKHQDELLFQRMTCKATSQYARAIQQRAGLESVFLLHEGDGLLDVGTDSRRNLNPATDMRPIQWYSEQGHAPKSLEIARCSIQINSIRYNEYLRSYVVYNQRPTDSCDGVMPWRPGTTRRIVVIRTESGTIERQDVPDDGFMRWNGALAPTRAGIAFIGTDDGRNFHLYVRNAGKSVQVMRTYADDILPAPDGCRVAVVTAGAKNEGLLIVDLCTKGR